MDGARKAMFGQTTIEEVLRVATDEEMEPHSQDHKTTAERKTGDLEVQA
jgi:hypothetical protein